MSENVKTFVLPDSNGNNNSDALLMSMLNGNGFGGNNAIWIIFLLALLGRNGFGNLFGGGGIPNASTNSYLNNDFGREMLLQAINGNGSAIGNLATTLNCDVNAVQTAINSVQSAVQSVGNQVGLSGQQVINAIQQGNMGLAQQLSQCCCENKQLVTSMGYEGQIRDLQNTASITESVNNTRQAVVNGFASTAYETQSQTCALQNTIKDTSNANTQAILSELRAMQNSAKDEKINTLTTELVNMKQNATIASMLAPMQSEIASIKASQPSTTTVQYPQLTAVPNYALYGGFGYGSAGFWG